MRKIVFFILLILFSWTSLAVNYDDFINSYINKIDIRLHKKFPLLNVYCRKAPFYYDKISYILHRYSNKYPKYKDFLNLFAYRIQLKKSLEERKCKTLLSSNSKNKIKKQNIASSNIKLRWDFQLNSVINTKFLNSLDKEFQLKPIFNYENILPLKRVSPLQDKIWFNIKVNNSWYRLNGYSYIRASSSVIKDIVKKADYYLHKYKADYLFYWNSEALFVKKVNVIYLDWMSPKLSVKQNLDILKKHWVLVIDKFYTQNNSTFPTKWIIEYNGKLFWFSFNKNSFKYFLAKNLDFLIYWILKKNYNLVFFYKNNFYLLEPWVVDFFYLWDKRLYGNVDLNKLWKILEPTFYFISRGYYTYTPKDMKDLIVFSLKFNWKKLSEVFKYMKMNFSYNEKISNFINKHPYKNWELDKYLNNNKSLMKNWIDFYTLKTKNWVCQTLSDIFSLVALFNWQNADIVDWYSNRWYYHQVSKVNNYYYDITYALRNSWLSYFGMTLKDLSRYFKIIKN